MRDFLLALAVVASWIVLSRWILPQFGIRTCMSGACPSACSRERMPTSQTPVDEKVVESKPLMEEEHLCDGFSQHRNAEAK